jgi:Zn2+/Cd2+-exporting ATPase
MAKGHQESFESIAREAGTGKIGSQILLVMFGGVLLICSFFAQFIYTNDEYSALLAMASAICLGVPLIAVAIKDVLRGETKMVELAALAVLAAFAIQMYMAAAIVAFIMYISVMIESRTAAGAQASIESLIRITPTRASRVNADGSETETEAKELKPGDIVRVRPGDNIPADGVIAKGQSTVNQASITGESLPVDKSEGDEAFGGTINVTGVMDIKVTKAGSDTTLGRVKKLILDAENSRIPLMKLIDRYASWYTPTVLMLVGIYLFFAMRLMATDTDEVWRRAISMLVLACPSAIILATPTAMVAALSAAARLGVLIKSVVDLEAARNLTAIIFDKTGTLTTGQLSVTRLTPVDGVPGAELLKTAAAAEQNSRHPVARAVIEVAKKARLVSPQPDQFEEVAGRGVRAVIAGSTIYVGRAVWLMESKEIGLSQDCISKINEGFTSPDAQGMSLLFVVKDGKYLGWLGMEDKTRAEASNAMNQLRELGMKRLIIVTGDRESVAKKVATEMNVEYKAEVLPQEKLEMVDFLKSRGHRVAVVGDGVNDAPALAAGDISIAMGAAGSDVAIQSARIALMNNNLNRIPFIIRLSRTTTSVIYQNMVIAGLSLLIFIPLAAAGYIGPVTAAILHEISGLIVIFNSARLVRLGEDVEFSEAEHKARNSAPLPAARSSSGAPTPATA